MAGESPDRSKQQKSSGTTRTERDPRLDVFREPATGGAEAAESAPSPAEDAQEAPETAQAAPDSSEAPEAAGEAAEPAEPEEGDARLRAAVAAWVSKPDADGDDDDGDEADGDDTASEEPVARVPRSREEAVAEPEAGSETESEADAPARAASDEDDQGSESEGASADTATPVVAQSAPERTAPEKAAPEKAAPEKTAPGKPAVDEEEPEKAEPEPDATAEEEPDAAAEEPAADSGEKAPGPAAEKPEAAADEPEADEPDAEKPETEREAPEPAAAKPEPDAPKPAAPEPAAEKPDAPDPGAAPDKAPVVDQPTAVFKAPRLPQVDQPTTALKITRSPSGKPELASEPESLTERTSRFVPLRTDDVRPAPRKPDGPAPEPGVRPAPGRPAPASLSGAERTRQQPMPPKPPLDLLAELTNTPPPPETPVRTAVRRVKIWTPLVLLLLIVFAIVQMVRPLPDPSLTMTAKSTYSFRGDTPKLPWPDQGQGYMAATGLGKVDSFGEQKPVPIASVAKAMTAYLVLKSHPLKRGEDGPDIKIDAKAESDGKLYTEGESTLSTVKEGDVLSEREALTAIMIPSANNIARLLARWEAGSEKAFVAKMNATADELGMKNTTYTDPSGLTASTVSTAEDLVKLGEKLVEFPALMDITKLPEWKDPSGHVWRNYNTLVPFDGALGIKTGSTTKAGGNLLFAAHKMIDGTDQLIVGAVLGQYDKDSIIDEVNRVSKKVMLATQDLLEGSGIVKKGDVVGVVDDGMGHTTPVVATKDVKAIGWPGLTVKLELTDDGRTIPHEAVTGTHVGTLTVGEGASQVKVAVALQSDLEKPSTGSRLTRLG
ncbi:D-alanyl-D-alanine carboxypeptidase [Streptomyces sp. A1277]|nr:D-alanyl-D-alanine carboxypeptidase [Streptomyces sp. A1277]